MVSGHMTDDAMGPRKVKVMTRICIEPYIWKTADDAIEWMNEWRKLVTRTAVKQVESEARAVAGRAKGGYTLRVVRDVRWVFSRRLKVSNVFDSLIAAGNSFQIVGEEKLKERLPKLVVQKGIDRRFWLAELRHRKGW